MNSKLNFLNNFIAISKEDKLKKINGICLIWKNYAHARMVLSKSPIIRTYRSPESEFAECLVALIYNGHRTRKANEKSIDIESKDKKIQVKSFNKHSRGYPIKEIDKNNNLATHYVFVIFNQFIPAEIFEIEIEKIKSFTKKHIRISDLKENGRKIDGYLTTFL